MIRCGRAERRRPLITAWLQAGADASETATPRQPKFIDEERTRWDGMIKPADITVE
jgi:hypothetical protein